MARLFSLSGRRHAKIHPLEQQFGFAEESFFNRMVCLERKRSERTKDPFILMLLNVEGLAYNLNTRAIDKVGIALASATRDTDITGWYKRYSTIGVILTALNGTNPDHVRSLVLDKVARALSAQLDPGQVQKIRISFHFFPDRQSGKNVPPSSDEKSGKKVALSSDEKLYPELGNSGTSDVLLKRLVDIAGSLCALIFLSPFLLIISALIKLTSRGPVLFKQRRLGKFAKEFTFLKFRSMYVDNNPEIHKTYVRDLIRQKTRDESGVYKIKNDPRITPFGRFLRKSSLDELPQLLNVLKGDMSLVGPRPPIPYEFECYELWHRRRVLEAKPGVTGLWQVNGRSRTTFDEMVRLDLRYVRNRSLWLDFKILLQTPLAVLGGDGAY
jgi:lipopolysaccharide/colanic/teichoic acid biosynthesis glycosyltransferase